VSDTQELFLIAAVWAAIAAFIVKFLPNWPARIAVFALLVGIPFWELPYGYFNFRTLCGAEARLQVFEKIQPQATVCADYPFVTLHERLLRDGFSTVETRGRSGDINRYVKTASGKISSSKEPRLASNYCLTFQNNNRLPWRVLRHDTLVIRSDDRKVAARESRFHWAGMWWQDEAKPVLGRGGECSANGPGAILALQEGASTETSK
jgi:hypothetical protein